MKPLVADERRDELRLFYYGTQEWMPEGPDDATPGDIRRAFDAAFHLALAELGVVKVHLMGLPEICPFKNGRWCEILENMCGFECNCECACPLRKGSVLIRTKKAEKEPE